MMPAYHVSGIVKDPHGRCACKECRDSHWRRNIDRIIEASTPEYAISGVEGLLSIDSYWLGKPVATLIESIELVEA